MSAWMEILKAKQTETSKIKTTRHSAHSSAVGGVERGGTKHANRHQKRLRKYSGNSSVQIADGKITTVHKSPGLLRALRTKLTGTKNTVRYVALKQSDLENGPKAGDSKSDQDVSDSSEEDLYAVNSRRKQQRRTMTRKGTYSMREAFQSSRQYYPATHRNIHQHFNNQQYQQQQQQQQQHEQTVVQQEHCNLHKGVVGKQQNFQKQQHFYQHQHQHQHHQPQLRPDISTQQYQNIGTWLPQNKNSPLATATAMNTQMNGKIDDIKYHRHHEQQHEQQQHHHLHYQQQQQQTSNYCTNRLDANTVNGRNSCLIKDIETDFIVGKTFITPPDIPSPPPQPKLSDNKRFQPGQMLGKTTASATAVNTLINSKNCCQCEGRSKNLQFLNHTPVAAAQQQYNNNSHCHLHHQNTQSQQQQQQNHITTTTTRAHHNSMPHKYQHGHHYHHQQQQQLNNDENLILPKASSPLKSLHYHNQQSQHTAVASQQYYRKIDVFAAASLHDDDNDTSPSIKLSHHQYELLNGRKLLRNCKHLQNKQLQEQHNQQQQHFKQNGLPHKTFNTKQDCELFNGDNDDKLSRGLSLESNHSFYEAELNSCTKHQQQQQHCGKNIQQACGGTNDDLGNKHDNRMMANDFRVNGPKGQQTAPPYQHIFYNNESQENNYKQGGDFEHSDKEAGHDNINNATLASSKTYRKFVLPLDIPTPSMNLGHNVTKRLLSSHNHRQTACQCDKQTNFMQQNNNCINNNNSSSISNLKNQVNHISFIQTTTATTTSTDIAQAPKQAGLNQHNHCTAAPSHIKTENLTLLHTKGSSSSSTLSVGSIGCSGLNLNANDQLLTHSQTPPLQHHHLCQQKNLKMQHFSNQQQQCATIHKQQHQHYHHHQQPLQHTAMSQSKLQQQQQHKQLPLYNAYASQRYLPQLPQLLNINSNSNSLTLSQRRMAPTFNRIAGKNYMKEASDDESGRSTIRYIFVGVLLAMTVVVILTVCLAIANALDNEPEIIEEKPIIKKPIVLEDVLQGKLAARHFNGTWCSGTSIIYKDNNAIVEYNVETRQKTRLLLDRAHEYFLYEKSADGKLLLLGKNYKKSFRYSFLAEYDIYDIKSGVITPLRIKNNQIKFLMLVQWSPEGNAMIINYERNLYFKSSAFAEEIAITDDTNPAILNGIPDWVYEEEVLASNAAAWFAPDGDSIAFIQFDDSSTNVINFPIYGEPGDLRFQYPYNRLVAYPKAGSPNPRVKLFTSDLRRLAEGREHLTNIPVPSALNTESDYIITAVTWLNNTDILSIWMNRIQNKAYIQTFNGVSRTIIYTSEPKTGWVDLFASPFKSRTGRRVAFIAPVPQESAGDYRHVVVGSTLLLNFKPVTRGKLVVTSILYWEVVDDVIFYTANTENNPDHLHVYAIRALVTNQISKCLTCDLHNSNGINQTYYTAEFNDNHKVIIHSLGPSVPQSVVYDWQYVVSPGKQFHLGLRKLFTWEDNRSLKEKVNETAMPTIETETIPIADGFNATVLLQYPPYMDRSGETKYPLLIDVYGGPDSFSVVDKWIVDWGTYLSSNRSVIYAKIDGRGSGLRGNNLLHSIYLKLGTVEIEDQINVTRQLHAKYNFIDANRTGIWGWSYGGYAAAMALANDDSNVFRCAASVAPVTDWAYYDSIYTERYMGLPTTNQKGYSAARLSTKAARLKNKKLLLVHGTLDDNVHYQQTMVLAKNLERNVVLFKQISYPDEDHALAGVRPHLYHSLDKFFADCFANSSIGRSQ